ncbi:hypothetical protein [Nostoc sp.]|uniref:hypothetical protein n=1 Tax=Nostoc sp. TaxID=1180 RepID=UPI002FF0D783
MINTNYADFWFKLDRLVAASNLKIDRPKGTSHPSLELKLSGKTAIVTGGSAGIGLPLGTEANDCRNSTVIIG